MGRSERCGNRPGGSFLWIGASVLVIGALVRAGWTNQSDATEDFPPVIQVPYEVKVEPTIEEISPVDLNTATAAEITLIPGLPDPVAHAIVRNRPYDSMEELLEVPGIAERRLELIQPYITLSPASPDPEKD